MSVKTLSVILAAGAVVATAVTPTFAQRNPAYEAARASGKVGEKTDGYLGYPVAPDAATRALVEDINIKRRAVYSEKARAANATVEEYAFTSGCRLILQTVAGEKYQTPSGAWTTRGSGVPDRDDRCPA